MPAASAELGASSPSAAAAGLLSPPLAAAPGPLTGGFFLSPAGEQEPGSRANKNPRAGRGPKKSTGGPRVV
jgi:hypothetical protein